MANNSIALHTEGPDFANSFNKGQEAAQGRQLNSLRMDSARQDMALQQKEAGREDAMELMKLMGSIGMGAMGGDINGQADPQKWEQGLDYLDQMGIGLETQKYRGKPEMAKLLVDASMTAAQSIQAAQNDRQFELSLARFEHDLTEGGKAPSGYRQAADGNLEFIPGGPADPKSKSTRSRPLTEGQAKTAGYAKRMIESEGILSTAPEGDQAIIDKADPGKASMNPLSGDFWESMNRKHGPNMTQSPEYQKFVNGAQEWVRAKLRKESGAAISSSEWDSEFRTYFPQPGDGAEVIKQKATLRATAIESMRAESRGGYEALFEGGDTGTGTVSSDAPEPSRQVIDGVTFEQDENGDWFEVE